MLASVLGAVLYYAKKSTKSLSEILHNTNEILKEYTELKSSLHKIRNHPNGNSDGSDDN